MQRGYDLLPLTLQTAFRISLLYSYSLLSFSFFPNLSTFGRKVGHLKDGLGGGLVDRCGGGRGCGSFFTTSLLHEF